MGSGHPGNPTTQTPMAGQTQPGGVKGQTYIRAVRRAETMLQGEYNGGAGRRRAGGGGRASPWASSQHAPGVLHGSMSTVSGPGLSAQAQLIKL